MGVVVRTAAEMAAVLKANPFTDSRSRNTLMQSSSTHHPPRDALQHAVGQTDETMALGDREIFVHYGSGMGRSKLQIPAAETRHGAQHEHRRDPGRDGVETLTRSTQPSSAFNSARNGLAG